ncbi:MAG: hypothetical protein K0S65_3879 [Labilithrix sp.]|jgi:hypothetical protein|nr:hypothetical protein [Labilithrix sp.]
MTDPERFWEPASPEVRALLASQAEDVPPDAVIGKRRALLALHAVETNAADAASPSVSALLRAPALCLLVGASMIALVGDHSANGPRAEHWVSHEAVVSTAAPHSNPTQKEPAKTVDAEEQSARPVTATLPVSGAPRTAPRIPAAAPPPAPPRSAPTSESDPSRPRSLKDELGALERAQVALGQERWRDALALVGVYRRDFPAGRFSVEVDFIEIEALAKSGAATEAAAKATQFLDLRPRSPYAQRIEEVTGVRPNTSRNRIGE